MTDEPNHTERQEDHSSEGYTKRIRTNNVAPRQSDSGPLTVVEFSLLPEFCDKLKHALDVYLAEHRSTSNDAALAQIIRDTMPPQILNDIREFGKNRAQNKTVYVMHNLPEKDFADISKSAYYSDAAYANFIMRGLGAATGLIRSDQPFQLVRNKHGDIHAGLPHKHNSAVDMLAGVSSDGAATRFIDFQTLAEGASQDIQDPTATFMMVGSKRNLSGFSPSDFLGKRKEWIAPDEATFVINSTANSQANDEWATSLKKHSQEVFVDKGSLAIWANDGEVFHQALHSTRTNNDYERHPRILIGNTFNRPPGR
jgi:hypothetical protein